MPPIRIFYKYVDSFQLKRENVQGVGSGELEIKEVMSIAHFFDFI